MLASPWPSRRAARESCVVGGRGGGLSEETQTLRVNPPIKTKGGHRTTIVYLRIGIQIGSLPFFYWGVNRRTHLKFNSGCEIWRPNRPKVALRLAFSLSFLFLWKSTKLVIWHEIRRAATQTYLEGANTSFVTHAVLPWNVASRPRTPRPPS